MRRHVCARCGAEFLLIGKQTRTMCSRVCRADERRENPTERARQAEAARRLRAAWMRQFAHDAAQARLAGG